MGKAKALAYPFPVTICRFYLPTQTTEEPVLAIQRVCEAVDVECPWADQEECGEEAAEVWPTLFAEALAERVEFISQ